MFEKLSRLASRVSCPCLALALLIGAQGLSALPAAGGALGDRPLPVFGGGRGATALPLPFDSTVVVTGRDVSVGFALKELNFIVKHAAGREFQIEKVGGESRWTKDGSSLDCNSNTQTLKTSNTSTVQPSTSNLQSLHRIFLGRSPESESLLGSAFFDSLADEESVVMSKGDDLFLVGGGQLGALYAVYDFVEDNLGFRHYFKRDDGFVVDKVSSVVWNGKPTRKRPAFRGYRKDQNNFKDWKVGGVRNRQNACGPEVFIKGYRNPLSPRIPGHGFDPFLLPPYDRGGAGWGKWLEDLKIGGWYKEHPEWFSLDQHGKRVDNAQLCLSNPGCREKLLENLIKWIRLCGPDGIYMVGSNDGHNDRYCWCKDCVALEKKYKSIGGPLWDWILWAGPELKRRGYDKAVICSLAYKGWRQTEIAPANIERFPDNFNCDAAFLNADRELALAFYDTKLPDGTTYNRIENLKKWCRLCKHVSYWYYGGNNPAQVYNRIQKEMIELYECGVESVGSCGTGGSYEFGDFTNWIFDRLLQDPYCDLEPDLKRIFEIKYGPAAKLVRAYVDQLDAIRVENAKKTPILTWTDERYSTFSFLTGRNLLDLRRTMDEALALAKGTPCELNVKVARFGLNIWTINYFHKIRECDAAAAAKIDLRALDAETRAASKDLLGKASNPVTRALDAMANYSTLKSEALPPELAKYPASKVHRILPPKHAKYYCGNTVTGNTCEADPQAASGWAWMDPLLKNCNPLKSGALHCEIYDSGDRKWLINYNQGVIPVKDLRKGEYALVRLGKLRITPQLCIIMDGLWGRPTNINQMTRLYDPTYQGKEWEFWLSIKAEGPKFFADADPKAESRIWIDQLFCVDLGVPEGK